jgi:ribosomal protein S18 acetylase RimI-like enzyme/O-antigen ligase
MGTALDFRNRVEAGYEVGLSTATRIHAHHPPRLDRIALAQMGICALPAMTFLTFGQRTWGGRWVYLVLLAMFGYCALRRQHARLGAVTVGVIPVLMLLRSDFYYSLPIPLLAATIVFWFLVMPRDVMDLWANVHIKLILILSTSYWLISFWLTGDYSVNLRVLELAFSVCAIFLLANSPRHLFTALVGIGFSALAICIALMPYGDRLGMTLMNGHQIGNPISLGVPLALIVTLAVADRGRWLLLERSVFKRVLFGVGAGALLLLTTSRGAVAVALVSVLVLLWLGKKQRASVILLLALLTLAIPLALATPRGIYLEEWFARTVSSDRSLTQISSGRSDQWMLFPRVFMDSPLWGYGPGLGRVQYAKSSVRDIRIVYRHGANADWHAIYLQLGIEAGSIGLFSLALVVIPLLSRCLRHLRATGEIVPLLGVVGFLLVAASVSAMDAISGVFLGLGFLSTKAHIPPRRKSADADLRTRILPLTSSKARRYLDRLMAVDATTMGEPWGPEQWLLDLPGKWESSWFILRAHKPIGFLIASRKESSLHIHRLATAANERHRGFGTKLLRIAARRAQAKGCLLITLKIDSRNEGAIRFYRRLGFRISDSSGENLTMFAACQEIVERSSANKTRRFSGFSRRNPS